MKTHDYIHRYRGYWSDGGKCRIRIYQEYNHNPVIICSQLPENTNTSVTNMAEYLAAEVIEEQGLATPLIWIEHYPEHRGKLEAYSMVRFSSWERREVCLGGVWRWRVGSPRWSPVPPKGVQDLLITRPHASRELVEAWSVTANDFFPPQRPSFIAAARTETGMDRFTPVTLPF